jgi:hypothetical protein
MGMMGEDDTGKNRLLLLSWISTSFLASCHFKWPVTLSAIRHQRIFTWKSVA